MGGVVKGIKKVIKGIVDVVKGIVNFVGDIVGFVFNPMGAFDVPTPGNVPADQSAQGVTITKNGTNVAIPIVYGFRRVGGSLIFAETKGDRNEYLIICVAICEGEIEGINRILVDDIELPLPSSFGTTGASQTYVHGQRYQVKAGRFKNLIEMQIYNGKEVNSPTNSQILSGDYSPGGDTSWTLKTRKLPGVAYAAFQFKYPKITEDNQDSFPWNGGLPKVQFDVLGKKVYDVSAHTIGNDELSADYDSLPKRYHGQTTTNNQGSAVSGVVGTNPANCLLDYLMNTRYGCGIPKEQINAEAFRHVAQKCKSQMNYYTDNGVQFTGPVLTMNTVVDTNMKIIDNVKLLVAGNRGIMPYVGGRYKLKMEDGGTNRDDPSETDVQIAFAVDKDYVVGGVTLDGERKNTKLNEVLVNFIDPDKEFTNQQVVYSVSGDQGTDNNEKLVKEFTFHSITNQSMAETTARQIYKKSRNQKSIQFTGTQELLNVEVGDIITLTDSVLGFTDKQFRVAAMKLNADFTVDISAVEHDATVYDFIETSPYIVVPPIFKPDEIQLRPRIRTLPDRPIGVVPPVSPEPDSADDGQIENPLPEQPDVPITTITEWVNDPAERFNRGGNLMLKGNVTDGYVTPYNNIIFNSTSGFAFGDPNVYGATHSTISVNNFQLIEPASVVANDWVMYRDTGDINRGFASNKKTGAILFYLAQPKHVGITSFRVKSLDSQGRVLQIKNYSPLAGEPVFLTNTFNNSAISNFQIRWVQTINGIEKEHLDGSVLGSIVTYYDSGRGKNIRGSNIETYINYAFQNIDAYLLGNADYVRFAGDRLTFEVNLGA